MGLFSHQPAPPLDAFIECLWYSAGDTPQRRREFALPSGRADLVFNLLDEPIRTFATPDDTVGWVIRDAVVHGPQSRSFVLDDRKRSRVVGIHFRPAGAVLLGVPPKDLCDRHVALEDLWGVRARTLRDELLAAGEPDAMFAVLEREFLRRLNRPVLVHPAVSFAVRRLASPRVAPSIASVREETGYGERRFATLFSDAVGLTPKVFARVQRLHRVTTELARGDRPLAEIALAAGYYDQAHFSRDFRDMTGITPGSYASLPGRSVLHTEVREDGFPPARG